MMYRAYIARLLVCCVCISMMPAHVYSQTPPEAAPVPTPSPMPQAIPAPVPAPIPAPTIGDVPPPPAESQENAPPPVPEGPKKLTTLFFTPAERQVLAQAKLFYSRQGLGDEDIYDEEELLKQLNNVKLKAQGKQVVVSRETYYPQFYLESIIYHSSDDWKIRVKDDAQSKEFWVHTPAAKDASLKVISVSREQVTFEWTPPEWQRVVDTYKVPSAAIFLDTKEQKVIFSLMVNQTLFSYDMTLREGQMNLVRNNANMQVDDPAMASNTLPDIFSDGSVPGETQAPVGEDPFTRDLPGVVNAFKKPQGNP